MKRLTLVRHAESSWGDEKKEDDVDRPLSERGRRDAARMGRRLAQRGFAPGLILSSPAVRALATAESIAAAINYPREAIVVEEWLYGAGIYEWFDVIQRLDDSLEWVICVGHNPGLTDVVNDLSPFQTSSVPPGGVVHIEFDTDTWVQVGEEHLIGATYHDPQELY